MSTADNAPFDGAHALIFGGAKGIGKAVALEWARRGAGVTVADVDEAAARATAGEIVATGGRGLGVHADVLSEASMAAAVDAAEAALGSLSIVMNNVGAILNGHPLDIPMAEWQRIFELNYFSIVRSNAIVLPRLLARGGGHVVNTASFAGLYPYAAGRIPYASSKAAVISMTENLALLLEPQGIAMHCLVPGPVLTAIAEGMANWTPDLPMYGPGSDLAMMLPGAVATVLSDGMREGRLLIPSDDEALAIIQRHAADPDGFVRGKIADFARGEAGMPRIPPELLPPSKG